MNMEKQRIIAGGLKESLKSQDIAFHGYILLKPKRFMCQNSQILPKLSKNAILSNNRVVNHFRNHFLEFVIVGSYS